MKSIFMENECGFGNCRDYHCERCPCFKPTMFGFRVPRILGNIGYYIEARLVMKGSANEDNETSR